MIAAYSRPERIERRSPRIPVRADVIFRKAGHNNYQVAVHDLSRHGCCLEFVDRPRLDERVWVKFDGLETLDSLVCWVKDCLVGVEFERPIHPAVFDLLLARLGRG